MQGRHPGPIFRKATSSEVLEVVMDLGSPPTQARLVNNRSQRLREEPGRGWSW